MATLNLAKPLYVNFFHTAGSPEKGLLQDGKKQIKRSLISLQFQIPGIIFNLQYF